MDFLNLIQWPAMAVSVTAAWLVGAQSKRRRQQGFWCFLARPVDVPASHAVLFPKGFRDNEDYDRADQTAAEEHVEERIAGGRDGQE